MWVITENSAFKPRYLVKVSYNNAYWNFNIGKAQTFNSEDEALLFYKKYVRFYVDDVSSIKVMFISDKGSLLKSC